MNQTRCCLPDTKFLFGVDTLAGIDVNFLPGTFIRKALPTMYTDKTAHFFEVIQVIANSNEGNFKQFTEFCG